MVCSVLTTAARRLPLALMQRVVDHHEVYNSTASRLSYIAVLFCICCHFGIWFGVNDYENYKILVQGTGVKGASPISSHLLVYIVYFSTYPLSSHFSVLIFSFENRPAPFPGPRS